MIDPQTLKPGSASELLPGTVFYVKNGDQFNRADVPDVKGLEALAESGILYRSTGPDGKEVLKTKLDLFKEWMKKMSVEKRIYLKK